MTVPPPPAEAEPVPPPNDTHMPLRTRRAVLIVLWVVFALWVAALVAMYFGTVYPHRHPHGGRGTGVAASAATDGG